MIGLITSCQFSSIQHVTSITFWTRNNKVIKNTLFGACLHGINEASLGAGCALVSWSCESDCGESDEKRDCHQKVCHLKGIAKIYFSLEFCFY